MRSYSFRLPFLLTAIIAVSCLFVHAQTCPDNIDFEKGNFDGWTCYTGNVTGNGVNEINLTQTPGPVFDRHTMYTSFPGDGVDRYGGFPVNCPNGSGHSIRLGNDKGGGEAEGISYEFVIPANENYYTLIYNYAVVFQDPNHQEYQQPRMEIEILNETDNKVIYCSSFTFVPYQNILPGFFESSNPGSETPVWCKDWTAVSINLDGHAGKRIRLFFKTADCTFQRHFGYAYIDVNSECSGTFVGATYCPDDKYINVVAPYGYQGYKWFNNDFTQVLGTEQVLNLQPPPPVGTTIAVQLIPYQGYGCIDTLYAQLIDTLKVTARAGADKISCNHEPVPLGEPPKAGLIYKWSPATGLTNAFIANPYANPATTTTYVLTVNHDGGGCFDTDTVVVYAGLIDTSLQLLGKTVYCLGSGDSTVMRVQPTDSIQWYRDNIAIAGAIETEYRATTTGVYYVKLFNALGCILSTRSITVNISSIPVPGVAPGALSQCLVGNQFLFINNSTNAVGSMQYQWQVSNGVKFNTKDVSYSFPKAGIYNVKMIVNSNAVCMDSVSFNIVIYQNAIADFTADPVCINLPMVAVNKTVDTMDTRFNYNWSFGNGKTSTQRNPPVQVYPIAGTYSVSLSVNTAQCPEPISTLTKNVVIDKPKAAINYPVQYAVINYPFGLEARQFGNSVLWSPGTWLDTRTSYTPTYKGSSDQLYTITITTATGCVTVDTQLVKAVPKAEIFVPTAFTPNHDGLNDFLKPVVYGVKEIHYFRVYNRWGQVVYERKAIEPGWDGTVAGVPQGTQVYIWMVEGVGVDNTIITKKGTTTLVR